MLTVTKYRSLERQGDAPAEKAAYHLDPAATAQVARILRNMYSRPVEAVVREYLANAVDAHKLAGKSTEDIEVRLPTDNDPVFEIRDFGPGLSKDDTTKLLLGFGASGGGKRESNEFVGGFGIGCKSAFSVADQFFYVVWHGGLKRQWRCYLDETDAGWAELVSEDPSEEPSGIAIQIPIRDGQEQEYAASYGRVAWLLKPTPRVLRGIQGLGKWAESLADDLLVTRITPYVYSNSPKPQVPSKAREDSELAWATAQVYLDNPDFWRGEVSLNGVPVKWIWLPNGSGLTPAYAGASGNVYIQLGWQLYSVLTKTFSPSFKTPGYSIFEENFIFHNRGRWVIQAPVGTVPLSPTREDLQYSPAAQKTLIGLMTALDIVWKERAKKMLDDWSGTILSLEDAAKLEVSGLSQHFSWIMKSLKCADNADPNTIVEWKLRGFSPSCNVRMTPRDDLYEHASETIRPWAGWKMETPSPADLPHHLMGLYAKRKKQFRYSSKDALESFDDVHLNCFNLPEGGPQKLVGCTQLVICPVATPHGEFGIPDTHRVIKYALTRSDSVGESLHNLGLCYNTDPLKSKLSRTLSNIASRGGDLGTRVALVMFLFGKTTKEVIDENPWLKGAYVVPYEALEQKYKAHIAASRSRGRSAASAIAPDGTRAPVLRAKAQPLDHTKYHIFGNNERIDPELLRDASSRVYLRGCRDRYYQPKIPGLAGVDDYLKGSVSSSGFTEFVKMVEPTAYPKLLAYRCDGFITHPNRYGTWIPFQEWFLAKLKAKAEEYNVPPAQLGRMWQAFLSDSMMPLPLTLQVSVQGTPNFGRENDAGTRLKQFKNWWNWLDHNVTTTWGRAVLDLHESWYGFRNPKAWDMLEICRLAYNAYELRDPFSGLHPEMDVWWSQASAAAVQVDEINLKLTPDHPIHPSRMGLTDLFGRGEWLRLRAAGKIISTHFDTMSLSLRYRTCSQEWFAFLRSSWVVFEAAWNQKKIPALPPFEG